MLSQISVGDLLKLIVTENQKTYIDIMNMLFTLATVVQKYFKACLDFC